MSADNYCFICSMPPYLSRFFSLNTEYLNKNLQKSVKDIEKKFMENCKYFNDLTILTFDDKVIHNCYNEGVYGDFYDSTTNKYNITSENFSENINYTNINNIATWLHTDCYKFLSKLCKINLLASHIPFLLNIDNKKKLKLYKHHQMLLSHIDYGDVTKYCEQYFNYENIINDKNEWMCFGYNNDKNISRIKKVINQFKIKAPNRSGPIVSASFYPDGIIKFGNNGKFWMIKNNKWMEIKDEVIKIPFSITIKSKDIYDIKLFRKNKIIKLLNLIPQISLYNKVPIFLSNIDYYSEKKREYLYDFEIVTVPYYEKDITNGINDLL